VRPVSPGDQSASNALYQYALPTTLTTVTFDLRQAGRQRAEAIMADLAGREPQVSSRAHWKLIERASA